MAMMKCEVCGRGMKHGVTLLRRNPKGEMPIWRCEEHAQPPPEDLAEVVALIQRAAKQTNDG